MTINVLYVVCIDLRNRLGKVDCGVLEHQILLFLFPVPALFILLYIFILSISYELELIVFLFVNICYTDLLSYIGG